MSTNSDYDIIMGQKLKNHAQVTVEKLHPSSNNWQTLQSHQRVASWEHVNRQSCRTHVVYVFQHMRGKIFLMSQLLQLSTPLSSFKTLTQSCQIPDDGKVNINRHSCCQFLDYNLRDFLKNYNSENPWQLHY